MERRERYVRIVELARRIFELGQESFIEFLLDNLRHRDLEGAAFEADVVRMLVAIPNVAVDLRIESGTKADDYNIDLRLDLGRCWSIEVKTRADNATYSDKSLARTLDKARLQLPPNGIGAIFVKLPTPWLGNAHYRHSHAGIIANFLRNTSRVQAVVLVWDGWTPMKSGLGLNWNRAFRIFRAGRVDGVISRLLDVYEKAWKKPWDMGPRAPF